jgi:hypothetical protein
MKRPPLHAVAFDDVRIGPGVIVVTMSPGQWTPLLAEAYRRGHTLVELDADEKPVAAYRRCECGICNPGMN